MDKLKQILARCKYGVFLTVNEHRDYYITAEEEISGAKAYEYPPDLSPEVEAKMIETDTIIRLQFYPDTPTGSYEIWHYDLDAAIDAALATFAA